MSRAHSSFIPSEQLGTVVDWDFGAVDQTSLRFAAKLQAQAVAEDAAKTNAARQEGYAEGYAQGHAQATLAGQRYLQEYIDAQGHEVAQKFGLLLQSAQAQIADSEQVIAQGVLELACELAKQVLRQELSANPNSLLPAVREAVRSIAVDSKAAVVHMHPLDMDVMADVLRDEFPGLALQMLSDSTLTQGGCVLQSAGTVVDATVEKRWSKAVAKLGLEVPWEQDDESA